MNIEISPAGEPQRGNEPALSAAYEVLPREDSAPDDSRGLKIPYVRILWLKKWWILAAAVMGSALGVMWSIWQVPVYSASAVIEIVGFNESFMGLNQFDPQAGTGSYSGTLANIQTQRGILMSSALRNRVIERLTFETTPTGPASTDVFSKLRNRLGLLPQEPSAFTVAAIRGAAGSLSVKGVGTSRLMEVSCDAPSAEIAAAFVNTLASEFVSQSAQQRTSTAVKTSQWLESQIEETKLRVEAAESKLQEFVKREGLAFVLDQNTLADSKLRQLQSDLSALQNERITKQSRYELAKSSPVDSLPEILDDGTLRKIRDEVTDLRKERARLLTTLTEQNVKVQRIDAQIAEYEGTMRREKENLLKRIQNEYEASLRREKLMAGAYASQSQSLADQADKAGQYALLKREAEMGRQSYNVLLQQFSQASLVSAVPANTLRIVDTAVPMPIPLRPKPITYIATGTLSCMGLAAAIALLLAKSRVRLLSKVFASPGHLGPALQIPELGVIPALVPRIQSARVNVMKGLLPASDNDSGLVAFQDGSILADSFRYALASVLGQQTERKPFTFVVTSPGASEGKTTLAANLGIAVAQTGRRVLLIDADLRRARLHSLFKVQLSPGFSEAVLSEAEISEISLRNYLQPTSVERLSVLAAGSAGAEQIGPMMFSSYIPRLIKWLKTEFDVILIDTPPALQFPDARILGHLTEGVVLIVRSGITNRQNVSAAVTRFAQDGVPVIGTILNDWSPNLYGDHSDALYGAYYNYANRSK